MRKEEKTVPAQASGHDQNSRVLSHVTDHDGYQHNSREDIQPSELPKTRRQDEPAKREFLVNVQHFTILSRGFCVVILREIKRTI